MRQVLIGGIAREPSSEGRSGEAPEPTVKSGWKKAESAISVVVRPRARCLRVVSVCLRIHSKDCSVLLVHGAASQLRSGEHEVRLRGVGL